MNLEAVIKSAALAADLIMASKSFKKEETLSKSFKNNEKCNDSPNTHPNKQFLIGNSISRQGEGLGMGPGAPKRYERKHKIRF